MRKLWIIINTIRYLKVKQILYQLKYRVFGFSPVSIKQEFSHLNDLTLLLEADLDVQYNDRYRPDDILKNKISLLNESIDFCKGVWQYLDKSHLWNFNLHYFEFAIPLGVKYKQTGDQKYYQKYRELYLDWIASNDVSNRDAWHPYTISLRIVNLLVINELFSVCIKQDAFFFDTINNSLYKQFLFLEKNKEFNLLGNHLFENLKTLYIGSVYFKDINRQKKYSRQLLSLIKKQFFPDGMHYELSFMYQNILIEGLLRVYKCSPDRVFKNILRQYLSSMLDASSYMVQGLSRLPFFNDSAEGVAKSIDALNESANSLFDYIYKKDVHSLKDSGYYRMEFNKCTILVDCGRIGADEQPGHVHCDALSFEFFFDRKPLIVNCGTYQYQSELRSFFRSTKAHNTLVINGHEQSECWAEHRVGRRIKKINAIIGDNFFKGSFKNINGEVHYRTIKINNGITKIIDRVESKIIDSVHGFLHIAPEYECIKEDKNKIGVYEKKTKIKIVTIKINDVSFISMHSNDALSYYSEKIGKLDSCTTMDYLWEKGINEQSVEIIINQNLYTEEN